MEGSCHWLDCLRDRPSSSESLRSNICTSIHYYNETVYVIPLRLVSAKTTTCQAQVFIELIQTQMMFEFALSSLVLAASRTQL